MNDNLLSDPVITVRDQGKEQWLSLPGVLAALGQDAVECFPALRPHQRHAWHAFLCQLAALALERVGETDPAAPSDEAVWRELLRDLTAEYPDDEPWRLVVADLARPAFLQPPVPEGNLNEFKIQKNVDYESPYGIDILITSKKHGEKDGNPAGAGAESWFLGILMLQTYSGHLGGPNYGISRQNGGFAARHGVSLNVSLRPGPNWQRDCRVILGNLGTLRRDVAGYPEKGGLSLLWLEPWAGSSDEALPLNKLHPLFVEVCRRIRLVPSKDGGIAYRATGTMGRRVDAEAFHGVLGDPWLPLRQEKGAFKAFNSRPGYDVAWKVLFDSSEYIPSLLQRFHPGDPEEHLSMVFRVFLRTQGGSDGYHERVVPIQKRHVGFVRQRRDHAAETAKEMARLADAARKNVLHPALLQLMQAARENLDFKQKETSGWAWKQCDRLSERMDAEFFPLLWRCLDARGEGPLELQHLTPWADFLTSQARAAFHAAADALPTQGALNYRSRAKGENLLERNIKEHLRTRSDNG